MSFDGLYGEFVNENTSHENMSEDVTVWIIILLYLSRLLVRSKAAKRRERSHFDRNTTAIKEGATCVRHTRGPVNCHILTVMHCCGAV